MKCKQQAHIHTTNNERGNETQKQQQSQKKYRNQMINSDNIVT